MMTIISPGFRSARFTGRPVDLSPRSPHRKAFACHRPVYPVDPAGAVEPLQDTAPVVGDRNGTKVVAAVISGAGLAAPVIGNLSHRPAVQNG